MKKLYIVRHAKSSWDDPYLRDFDRPLNKRGKKNVPDMGQRLAKLGVLPDLITSSPANRALTTARGIAREIGYPNDKIVEEPDLYHASSSSIKQTVANAPDTADTLMIFGHNPGFTSLISDLSDFNLWNLPTCAVCGIQFQVDSWQEIRNTRGVKFYYDYPKSTKI